MAARGLGNGLTPSDICWDAITGFCCGRRGYIWTDNQLSVSGVRPAPSNFAFVVVQLLSYSWLFVTSWTIAHQAPLSSIISCSLLKFVSIELLLLSNHLICLLALLLLPSIFLSLRQGLFQWVGSSYYVVKVLELSFSISPSNEYSGLISFRIDWVDLFAVQQILKSLLQHHNLKHQFLGAWPFIRSNSHIHPWLGKSIALTIWTFVSKVMSLFFNMLSRFVIAFLPRSHLAAP